MTVTSLILYPYMEPKDIVLISSGTLAALVGTLGDIFLPLFSIKPRWFVRVGLVLVGIAVISYGLWHWI